MPKKLHISNSVAYTELLNHIVTASTEKAFAYEIDLKCYMLMLIKQILMDVRLHVISQKFQQPGQSRCHHTVYSG